jgi:transposase-like protein
MNSDKPNISQGALDKFSYLDLVEMHDDLEEWMEVWQNRLTQLQEEIKKRIEDNLLKK